MERGSGATESSGASAMEGGLRELSEDNDMCTTAENKRLLNAKEQTVQKKMRGVMKQIRDDGEMVDMNITNMAGTTIRISSPIRTIRMDTSQECALMHLMKINKPNLIPHGTHAPQGRKKGVISGELLLRPGYTSLTQLLHDVCPRLNLVTKQSTLLVDGVPFKGSSTVQASVDSAGINNNSMLTVVARQRVALRCHYVIPSELRGQSDKEWMKKGQHYMKYVSFEAGQRLGEPWPALPKFTVCFTGTRSLQSHSRNRDLS